jgi:DNA-binding ferritin-like protein (Dps family)
MYRRVKVDEQYDIELILKYLTSISDKIDWFDVDIFDKVLEMRDAAMKAS